MSITATHSTFLSIFKVLANNDTLQVGLRRYRNHKTDIEM